MARFAADITVPICSSTWPRAIAERTSLRLCALGSGT